uniref:Uncharacterized protein n=1 Tax=Anguilla anguilla TaxID=7936 RepID=A0A0E9VHM0_ANGAN
MKFRFHTVPCKKKEKENNATLKILNYLWVQGPESVKFSSSLRLCST